MTLSEDRPMNRNENRKSSRKTSAKASAKPGREKKRASPKEAPNEGQAAPGAAEPKAPAYPTPDFAALALNFIQAATLGQKAARLMADTDGRETVDTALLDLRRIGKTMLDVTAQYVRNPLRLLEAQAQLWNGYATLMQSATRRLMGMEAAPVIEPSRGDKRFKDPEWQSNIVFDLMKQSYLLASQWLTSQVQQTDGIDEHTRKKAEFYVRQFANAFSPSNFLLTNPEVLRTTLATNGENLVLGMQHLLEDVERGNGRLQIQQTDMKAFEVGRNIALTPGKVVYQNDLIQLLQYEPTTEKVHERPLLIFPPWINKYYILDLTPEKSFVKWATAQGFTVFVVSWVNPDARLAMKSFEDYMFEGAYAALDAVEKATGEREVNAIGYCIGGTLLASSLAHMAAKGDDRIKSATFFATQVDFTEAGDLQVFIDEEQISGLERQMEATGGVLEGSAMAQTFNMLRSNELIWSYVVNNYLLGREPVPFDLLYWNADATRMPAKMHLFYLRECYLRNHLAEGRMELGGVKLDLHKVRVPIYLQSSREDHIAPYNSVYKATRLFGGPVKFIVAGSGHIAGVINPPAARKYQYWTSDERPQTGDEWLAGAEEHPGSWWPDWEAWVKPHSGHHVPARKPGDRDLRVLEDAPGSYVKVKSAE
ncbi:MAG TPA: class I poly(R)-hydroxyalkanoic acid synthase [Parvibaculum sp.]|uniref:class I poly(R)-hydroxyalkanoic acid synthase n=1 Tax=Parvibaculum sp. TaxID=2024848 RepID=UPI002C5C5134|nr:class I poly(R)-hydroxyalkanoic acid synthase [Parvibaculum sp.]HMM13474.1 class I poly(R)-hydroxyalkanoic acid synthase [Parvibaculum sp.]